MQLRVLIPLVAAAAGVFRLSACVSDDPQLPATTPKLDSGSQVGDATAAEAGADQNSAFADLAPVPCEARQVSAQKVSSFVAQQTLEGSTLTDIGTIEVTARFVYFTLTDGAGSGAIFRALADDLRAETVERMTPLLPKLGALRLAWPALLFASDSVKVRSINLETGAPCAANCPPIEEVVSIDTADGNGDVLDIGVLDATTLVLARSKPLSPTVRGNYAFSLLNKVGPSWLLDTEFKGFGVPPLSFVGDGGVASALFWAQNQLDGGAASVIKLAQGSTTEENHANVQTRDAGKHQAVTSTCDGLAVGFGENVAPVRWVSASNGGIQYVTCNNCPITVQAAAATATELWFADASGLRKVQISRKVGATPNAIAQPLGNGFAFQRLAIGNGALFGTTATKLVRIGP
jgi:hypothetical protein